MCLYSSGWGRQRRCNHPWMVGCLYSRCWDSREDATIPVRLYVYIMVVEEGREDATIPGLLCVFLVVEIADKMQLSMVLCLYSSSWGRQRRCNHLWMVLCLYSSGWDSRGDATIPGWICVFILVVEVGREDAWKMRLGGATILDGNDPLRGVWQKPVLCLPLLGQARH